MNVKAATVHPKVTENIYKIIDIVQTLVDKGYAYPSNGDVYFRAAKFKEYGKLSHMPLEDLVDKEKELERLKKEEARLEKEIARSNGMLKNEKFLAKAPQAKVDEEKAKLEKYEQMMAQVKERLAQF